MPVLPKPSRLVGLAVAGLAFACSVFGSDLGSFTEGGGTDGGKCPAGQLSCAGDCIDATSDPKHCGACDNACAAGKVCDVGACADSCSGAKTDCSGACVDLDKDPKHCGDCAVACNAGQSCSSGSCSEACASGKTACGGSCVDLQSDDQHCGACGNNCPTGQACQAGKCELSCSGTQTECSGACVDTSTNVNHCGGCGKACKPGEVCTAGACKIFCPGGQVECNGLCEDLQTDDQNCGSCGHACQAGEVCGNGQCVSNCPTGQTNCGGSCVDTTSDPAHCGACGTACTATQECSQSKCVLACKTQLNQALTDPWGYSWDGLERAPATLDQASQICETAGGRLPTASELYRVSATQSATVGQSTHTNFLWSAVPYGAASQIRVRLSDASTSSTGKTSSLYYRCVCPPPLPATFTGKNCFGPAAQGCYGLDAENNKASIDAADRAPLPKGSAIWECTFNRGHLAGPTRIVEAAKQGIGAGSNLYLHTGDDVRNDSDLLLRWQTTFALSSAVANGSTTDFRPFRCTGSSVGGTHPSTVPDEWVPAGGGPKGETKDTAAAAWATSVSACFGRGGHVPTATEQAELVALGLPTGTNAWLWGADVGTIVLVQATQTGYRWTGSAPPVYASGNDFSTLARTSTQASRCIYYPVDTSYSGPSAAACAAGGGGSCKEITLPGGSGAKMWVDAFDRSPAPNLETAIDNCRKEGGHLASSRDYVEAIRAGLANGSGSFVWDGDFSLVLVSPLGANYVLRAGVVKWTGNEPAFGDAYGSSSSTTDIGSSLPYRCMWTNEVR